MRPLPGAPTEMDWNELLGAAARRGIRVWHIDRTGQLVPVETPPQAKQ